VGRVRLRRPWRRTFELHVARQYVFGDEHIEQVSLDMHFPPAAFRSLGTGHTDWSFDTGGSGREEQLRRWIAAAERTPAFRAVMSGTVRPLGYDVHQEDVD
jgi:hypothetical protein